MKHNHGSTMWKWLQIIKKRDQSTTGAGDGNVTTAAVTFAITATLVDCYFLQHLSLCTGLCHPTQLLGASPASCCLIFIQWCIASNIWCKVALISSANPLKSFFLMKDCFLFCLHCCCCHLCHHCYLLLVVYLQHFLFMLHAAMTMLHGSVKTPPINATATFVITAIYGWLFCFSKPLPFWKNIENLSVLIQMRLGLSKSWWMQFTRKNLGLPLF